MNTKLIVKEDEDLLRKNGFRTFSDFMYYPGGELVSRKRGRTVYRLQLDGHVYYLKRNKFHLVEYFKTICNLKLPTHNAIQEWKNIERVYNIGIPTLTVVALGERSFMGTGVESFILTKELYQATSLEEVIRERFMTESRGSTKKLLITKVAMIARKLHENGMYHQDFYLGHFYLDHNGTLYLIDLQRLKRKKKVPKHYIIKDLAQLNYSADVTGRISNTDRLRFFHVYLNVNHLEDEHRKLLRQVVSKTKRISKHTIKLLERRRRRKEIL